MGRVEITIDRRSSTPIYRQVVRELERMIRSGALPEGFRLPPERRLAQSLGVNRSTVLNAYRELKAQGLVGSHVGRGTAVLRPPAVPLQASGVPWRQLFRDSLARAHDPILADLLALTERTDVISFSIGLPCPELLPLAVLSEIGSRLLREVGPRLLLHCPTEGHSGLREALAQWMASRGIRARASDVLVVSGSQQGLDLLARVFLDPGDTVVVEEPTYVGALQAFRVARARIVGIPVDEHGLRTDVLAAVLERERPKLIYTLPTYQNPSGALMNLERRRRLLELASRWQVPVVEDDPYSELVYEGERPPLLRAMDDGGRVIYLSTFSKALFPGLRVGWVVAPPVVVRQLVLAKQGVDLHASTFSQYLLEAMVREGHLRHHLDRVRPAYRRRRDRMVEALRREPSLGLRFSVPTGGFYIWCQLPEGLEQGALLAHAAQRGVLFLPGRACYPTEPPQPCLRLNFTHASEQEIGAGVERLFDAIRETSFRGGARTGEGTTAGPIV